VNSWGLGSGLGWRQGLVTLVVYKTGLRGEIPSVGFGFCDIFVKAAADCRAKDPRVILLVLAPLRRHFGLQYHHPLAAISFKRLSQTAKCLRIANSRIMAITSYFLRCLSVAFSDG